jgi:hypothetical protein
VTSYALKEKMGAG